MNLQNEYSSLGAKLEQLRTQMNQKAAELIEEAFTKFFDDYGDVVKAISWTQYIPSFNDGEPCYFTRGDMFMYDAMPEEYSEEYAMVPYSVTAYEYYKKQLEIAQLCVTDRQAAYTLHYWHLENSLSSLGVPDHWVPNYTVEEATEELAKLEKFQQFVNFETDCNNLENMLNSIHDEVLEAVFGNDVQVIVTKDGITTEDYECGY